ncbi:MAG: hypothetical protein NZ805_08430 [Armatimonadetes bacterium]|nr:hypothetical protein [Armatimonadota bacterium]
MIAGFSPPSKDGAQKFRQRLWAKAHSMVVKKRLPTTFEVKSEVVNRYMKRVEIEVVIRVLKQEMGLSKRIV